MSVGSTPQKRERTSVVCIYEGKILCFLAIDPHSGQQYYFLPGGEIEPGESKTQCAVRETQEETNYRVKVDASTQVTKQYIFQWNGRDYDCITHFFRAHLDENFHTPRPAQDQDYNKGPIWLSLAKVPEIFSYNHQILNAVQLLL